jgi:hypothetical protein
MGTVIINDPEIYHKQSTFILFFKFVVINISLTLICLELIKILKIVGK